MNDFHWNPTPDPKKEPQEEPQEPGQRQEKPPESPPPYPPYEDPNAPPSWYVPPRPVVNYTPFYGQPPRPMTRSAKIFFGILIGLSVTFVSAFLVWVISMAIEKHGGDSPAVDRPNTSQAPTASSTPGYRPPATEENPIGTSTAPNFPGIVLNTPASPQLQPKEIYQKVEPAIVGILAESPYAENTLIGSGIVLTSDGYIATNAHVIDDSRTTKVTVVLSNKMEHRAVVVGYDRISDLAVLKIEAHDLPTVSFGSSAALSVGDWVFAIGNPRSLNFSGTLTRGIVSGLERKIQYYSENSISYIQTDAAINPGNSGGALVNEYGQVVGINCLKINPGLYEGMGFSISINKAKPILDSLIRHGYVEGRVRLGIVGMTVTEARAREQDIPRGVAIMDYSKDGAFAGKGVQSGDIITAVDGHTISSMEDLDDRLLDYQPGDTVTLSMYRDSTYSLTIQLMPDRGELQK